MEQPKLTLEKVSPYLSYGLKVLLSPKELTLNTHPNKNGEVGIQAVVRMPGYKLKLLPLSQLTSINHETHNPYIFDILQQSQQLPFKGRNNRFWKYEISEQNFLSVKNKYNDYSYEIDLENADLDVYHDGELTTMSHQLLYINGFFKYHFDVYKLIEAGLAVDKTA